jgi:hypothetical protein
MNAIGSREIVGDRHEISIELTLLKTVNTGRAGKLNTKRNRTKDSILIFLFFSTMSKK